MRVMIVAAWIMGCDMEVGIEQDATERNLRALLG
jgi:hypothetical protein